MKLKRKPTDLAWIAGFFDGEGCVSLVARHHTKTKKHIKTICLQVCIYQKNPAPLFAIKKLFGGTISGRSIHWRDKRAVGVLKTLMPYLRVKKEVARLGIKARKLVGKAGPPRKTGVWEKFLLIKQQVSTLNQKD